MHVYKAHTPDLFFIDVHMQMANTLDRFCYKKNTRSFFLSCAGQVKNNTDPRQVKKNTDLRARINHRA